MVRKNAPALALLVHPNMGVLSALQRSFEARGLHSVACREMPTALLALSQHDFSAVVVHHRVVEDGDGFALGSVARRLFAEAHIAVICGEKDVASLQAAINTRLNQVFDEQVPVERIADSISDRLGRSETEKVQ